MMKTFFWFCWRHICVYLPPSKNMHKNAIAVKIDSEKKQLVVCYQYKILMNEWLHRQTFHAYDHIEYSIIRKFKNHMKYFYSYFHFPLFNILPMKYNLLLILRNKHNAKIHLIYKDELKISYNVFMFHRTKEILVCFFINTNTIILHSFILWSIYCFNKKIIFSALILYSK